MSTRTLILFFICLASFTMSQITPIEFYYDYPKYFPANTFDTFNSDAFRTQAYGSFKYSIGTWFKISRAFTGTKAMLLHLTALDVDFPWDRTQYTSGVRHLANLIQVTYQSDTYLHIEVDYFGGIVTDQTTGSHTITTDCWHYVYVGVNHETGRVTTGVFSNGCNTFFRFTSDTSLGSTYTNEALDNRLTMYLGGSKNHIGTVVAGSESWPGSLYRTIFLNGFYTNNENTARFLMGGERKNMFFFYLDNTVLYQTIQSATDSNSYLTLGGSASDTTNDPVLSANGIDGFKFTSADDSKMFLTLSNELDDYNFVSFWVKITDVTPASAQYSVMSIRTPSGVEFLSIMYDKANLRFVLRRSATTSTTPAPAALDTWHFMFLTYTYAFTDSSTSIVVSWRVNSSPIMSNIRLSDPLPADILKPNAKVYFGKVTGASDNVFNGALRTIIGGSGTYFLFDTTTTCTLSIGFQTPYCLYCSPSSGLFSDPSGSCVANCPDGTYKDFRTMTCAPCDITCATCGAPGPAACTTCAEDTPLIFKGMCFDSCPAGTLKNIAGACDCDATCSTCNYDANSKATQCVSCSQTTVFLLPDRSKCVPPIECPTNTLADTVSGSCAAPASCPGGSVRDFANGKCYETLCPVGTSKVAGTPDSCYAKCPEGTYKTTNPSPAAGETDILCAPCTAPCKTCETSATNCLSCTGLNLYHEDVNTCAATCDSGFSFSEVGYFCKACRKGCTACSSILSLVAATNPADNLCVDTCPLGMTSVSRVCQASAVVDAQITNKTASVPTIMISRKQNLVLIGEYASPATVTSVNWGLDTTDSALSTQFFYGVVRTNKNLVIPAANLKADTTYKVTFEVKDSVPSTDLEFVLVKTSAEITQGTFSVLPEEGTAFQTEFSIQITGFNSLAGYKFDITAYFERNHTINGRVFKERVETLSIGLGVDQGTYQFIFPISQAKKPVTVEACAYTDYERSCMTKVITLLPSGDLPLQKVLVWSADASTLKTLDRMLDFVRSISLFYARKWDNQISTEYSRGALLIDNFAVTKNLVACNKIAECSNAGACSVSGSTISCSCELGFGGFNCFYGVREYDTISTRVRDILTNLYSVSLDITTVEKALLILEELTNTLDMIEYNSIFFFRDIVANALKVPGLKPQHFRPIFSVLAEVIGFVKRSLTATWFKATDRSLLLVSLTGLVDNAFSMLDGVRMSDSYFLVDTNFLKVMVINNVAGGFLGNTANEALSVDWETFGFTLPQDLVTSLPSSSVKMLGYKINPYSDAQTNGQMTSVMKVEIFNVNGAVTVANLTNNIELRIPKLAATPAFVPVAGTSAYNCQYKSSTVRSKINFLTTGCSFVSESETHVTCSCSHLTEFVAQLNLTHVAIAPSSADILTTNNEYITEILAFETAKRVYYPIVINTTTPTVTPVVKIVRDFSFPNIGLYFAAAIVGLYFLFMLCNMGNAKKNALKRFLDQGQSILVLTYHPVLSMFIKAHTTTSNTQLMRITKFFCMLSSYAGLTSIFYLLLDLELSLSSGAKLIISAFVTLIFGPLLCYGTEWIYKEIQRNYGKQRRSGLYQYSHLIMMLLWAGATIGLVGIIREDYRTSWMGSFILVAALDIVVFDMIILIFAMMQKNNSKYLKLFRARGYYVDTGAASIITPEDEAALIAKIKKVLHSDTLRDMDSAAVPAFGNINRIVGELEDLNASNATDINAEELMQKIESEDQPEQHEQYEQHNQRELPPLDDEEQDAKDPEIDHMVQGIARASIKPAAMRSLNNRQSDSKRRPTKPKTNK